MLAKYRLSRNQISPLLLQVAVVSLSYAASFLFRFDYDYRDVGWEVVFRTIPLLVFVRVASLGYFNLWRGLWRFVGVYDFIQIVKATTVSSLIFTFLVVLGFGVEGIPRSIFGLDWAGNIFMLAGARLLALLSSQGFRPLRKRVASPDGKRVMIVGAGSAGASLCREMLSSPTGGLRPVCFVDDDRGKIGDNIEGVPIVGNVAGISRAALRYDIELGVIAIPSATATERRTIVAACQRAGIEFKTVPSAHDIIGGALTVGNVREVDPADLLGRPPARLAFDEIAAFLRDQRVMITGAGGSVGSELAIQVARRSPKLLLLVDIDENSLFELDQRVRVISLEATEAFVCDVTDKPALLDLMHAYQPEVVFHAAAHKHVPLMERVPKEAVRNNVGGTLAVATAAMESGVERFVLISTDKAIQPVSVMGATKRLAERVVQDLNARGSTRFTVVRFGNVLGSNASVVPIFRRQIESGGPITVTHPEISRYFMSLSEAASLVLQAGAISKGGETFVLDMGEPVPILKLAQLMIELSGRANDGIDIQFTGLRPGEKLHEVVATEERPLAPTGYDKLLVLPSDDISEPPPVGVEELLKELPTLGHDEVVSRLAELVPDYLPWQSEPVDGPETAFR